MAVAGLRNRSTLYSGSARAEEVRLWSWVRRPVLKNVLLVHRDGSRVLLLGKGKEPLEGSESRVYRGAVGEPRELLSGGDVGR